MQSAELQGWIQAVGSVVAIVASVSIVAWQHRKEIAKGRERQERKEKDEEERRARQSNEQMERVNALIQSAHSQIHRLLADPDKPTELAQYWRRDLNNDVSIPLAQIDFTLDQIRSIPVLDVPIGANVFGHLSSSASALAVAKVVLSREVSEPFSSDTSLRVSTALRGLAKLSAARAVVHSSAITEATRLEAKRNA